MNHTLSWIILLLLGSDLARATDRVVGPTSLYSSIGEALLASSDGDRLLIEPGMYREDISISKSVSLLPNQEGGRFYITGNVKIANASGKSITISGMRLGGYVLKDGACTGRTDVRVMDCNVPYVDLVDPYIHACLLRDTIGGQVQLSSGEVIGNEVLGVAGFAAGIFFQGASSLPDEIWVVGNSLGVGLPGLGISIASDLRYHVENNFVRSPAGYPALNVQRSYSIITAQCTVLNNTFYRATTASSYAATATNMNPFGVIVRNNALIGFTAGMGIGESHYSNVSTTASSIALSTGAPSMGSPLINAGDPDPRYLDLDLTTNDVGCYGGSNSRANFTTGMGSAVVGFMQAPRVVAQGEVVNINATGFDR